jgi:hypothetical protein
MADSESTVPLQRRAPLAKNGFFSLFVLTQRVLKDKKTITKESYERRE